ncbi:hypothetical protein M3Y95_00655400 [Aphelenchoides besseyi]|nr:hypothetical protein M3Y95_00655400 [Aphelenchoides besseyi]
MKDHTFFRIHIHITALIFAITHLIFRVGFIVVDAYVSHYYAVMADVITSICLAGIIYGHKRKMPTLYIGYLIFAPLYAMARIGFGVYVIIVAVDLLHDPKQEVETAIGNQSPRVAMVVGALQMIGGLVEFYFVKVIYEDFKYFKTLLQSEDEKNAVV